MRGVVFLLETVTQFLKLDGAINNCVHFYVAIFFGFFYLYARFLGLGLILLFGYVGQRIWDSLALFFSENASFKFSLRDASLFFYHNHRWCGFQSMLMFSYCYDCFLGAWCLYLSLLYLYERLDCTRLFSM